MPGRPAQFGLHAAGINGITLIMPGAIGNKRYLPCIGLRTGLQCVQSLANKLDDIYIAPFINAADVVDLARSPTLQHCINTTAVIIDE